MRFLSDASVAHLGFSLTWTSTDPVCGETISDRTHGSVASPGHPGNYPHNRDCTWTIMAERGKRIQFHFATLRIENHPNCSYDFVEVWDGTYSEPTKHQLGRFCNTTAPPPVTSSGHIASVVFHSDHSSSDTGFLITWSQVSGVPGCGGLFTSASGEITSPLHPDTQNYHNNLNCEYLIRAPAGDRISLSFLSFGLEDHNDCGYDYLELRDGGRGDSPLVGRYCGSAMPPDFASSSNEVMLKFYADWSVTDDGFRVRYEVGKDVIPFPKYWSFIMPLACGGTFTLPTGEITSPYFPSNYPNSRECVYVVEQPPGVTITLNFEEFDVESHDECRYDYLEVRDGDNENSSVIGRFCGDPTTIPAPIRSTHNFLWLK